MSIQGAWICRTCWKTNRPSDERCFRCKTPRTADDLPIEGRGGRGRVASPREEVGGVLGVLMALPALVFLWFWRLYLVVGILSTAVTVLVAADDHAPKGWWVVVAGFTAFVFLLAFAMRWASGGMRARNPWAFVVALVISVGVVGFTASALTALAPGTGNPVWMRYVTFSIFGFTAIMAAVGLLFSLAGMESADEGDPAKTDDPAKIE